jgi:hypothetical protein
VECYQDQDGNPFRPDPGSTRSPRCLNCTSAVVQLRSSWWWAERLPETCRAIITNIKLELSASVGFIHQEFRSQVWVWGLWSVGTGWTMPQGWNGLDVIMKTNTEAKNAWSYNLTPQHTFMVWTGITLVLLYFGQNKTDATLWVTHSYAVLVVSTVCRPTNHLSRKTKGMLYCI